MVAVGGHVEQETVSNLCPPCSSSPLLSPPLLLPAPPPLSSSSLLLLHSSSPLSSSSLLLLSSPLLPSSPLSSPPPSGVIFHTHSDGSLPAHLTYKIRQNSSFTAKTNEIRRASWRPGPNSGGRSYFLYGFVWIQGGWRSTAVSMTTLPLTTKYVC